MKSGEEKAGVNERRNSPFDYLMFLGQKGTSKILGNQKANKKKEQLKTVNEENKSFFLLSDKQEAFLSVIE